MVDNTLEIARRKIEALDKQIAPLQKEVNRLNDLKEAWLQVLSKAGAGAHIVWSPNPTPEAASDLTADNDQPTREKISEEATEEVEAENDYGGKIGAIRQMFRAAYPKGLTAAAIWKEVQDKGISQRRAFVYSSLNRLKKGDEIVKRKGGKYVALPKLVGDQSEEIDVVGEALKIAS